MRRIAGLLSVLVLLAASGSAAAAVPAGYTYSDQWITSFDGTKLHAGVFLPADHQSGEQHPTLMVMSPYTAPSGGASGFFLNPTGVPVEYAELFGKELRGGDWAVVQVDVRGTGGSGGCWQYYSASEVKDAGIAVDWAGTQPWSTGKVGMYGISYDGATQVEALAARAEHLAAAVIGSPGTSAYNALWMGGVHYFPARYATTATYVANDVAPGSNADTGLTQGYAEAYADRIAQDPQCRTDDLIGMNTVADRGDPFWGTLEGYRAAAGSDVPVFLSHGFFDANVKPGPSLEIFNTLTGPKQAWFGQFLHEWPNYDGKTVGRAGWFDQVVRFLDRYVRGVESPVADPAITVQEGDGAGKWRTEAQWPPADARPWDMPLHAGTFTDAPGESAGDHSGGAGQWSVTAPLPWDAHLAGTPRVRVPLTTTAAGVHLIAELYDIAPDGTATFADRGALLVDEAGSATATLDLYPQDWRFVKGHRIGLHVGGSDDDWFAPGTSATTVTIGSGGALSLPLLRVARTKSVAGKATDGMTSVATQKLDAATIAGATVAGDPPPQQTAG